MIRELRFDDIPQFLKFLRAKRQRDVIGVTEAEAKHADMKHWNAVIAQCLDSGCSFAAFDDDGNMTGLALGIKIPLIWAANRTDLYLMCVQADTNITTAKLFKTWHSQAIELPGINRVMVDKIQGTNFDYTRLGYEKLRETYVMEV